MHGFSMSALNGICCAETLFTTPTRLACIFMRLLNYTYFGHYKIICEEIVEANNHNDEHQGIGPRPFNLTEFCKYWQLCLYIKSVLNLFQ